jgi:prolyl oligopeptidase
MPAPLSPVDPVTDMIHGVPVMDPYRWLEDQESPRTRAWIGEQRHYTRAYFEALQGREVTRMRVQELLDVETYDSFLTDGTRYYFRKRLAGKEQPSIYLREGLQGEDQLLVDPSIRNSGAYTAVKPHRLSPDGRLLLYEVKQGGEHEGTFEILEIANRRLLPDSLPHGSLQGFVFAPDSKGFYYVHEPSGSKGSFARAAYYHVLGTDQENDLMIFRAGTDKNMRLSLVPGNEQLGFLIHYFLERTYTDFYLWTIGNQLAPERILSRERELFAPRLVKGRILAMTSRESPNRKIVEVHPRGGGPPLISDVVPEADTTIQQWTVAGNYLIVFYARGADTEVWTFDLSGNRIHNEPALRGDTIRLASSNADSEEILLQHESFTTPPAIRRYSPRSCTQHLWARRTLPFDSTRYACRRLSFPAKDGTCIPMFLVGRKGLVEHGTHPVIMTSYGGFGIPMTPQFSVLVAFLLERGCLFALPNIRGGSEYGSAWHNTAKRRNRQVAFDDFLSAAEWLIETRRTTPSKLAIFGGSNSGLLVAAAMTQRPDLFRAVLCMVPLTDMLRYHHFDSSCIWIDEYGSSDDADDFAALSRYSPYHNVQKGTTYPAVMLTSGARDMRCNPMHACKMTARLQAATASSNPILLDYNDFRGHSPVLPLSVRVEALTDRLIFLCAQFGILPT